MVRMTPNTAPTKNAAAWVRDAQSTANKLAYRTSQANAAQATAADSSDPA